MKRGEVWWAELPEPVGPRPVVILTRDAVLDSIDAVVVALVTRTARGLGSEVVLGRQEGLTGKCVANLDNLLTVPKSRLARQMGMLSKTKVLELNHAVQFALGIA